MKRTPYQRCTIPTNRFCHGTIGYCRKRTVDLGNQARARDNSAREILFFFNVNHFNWDDISE